MLSLDIKKFRIEWRHFRPKMLFMYLVLVILFYFVCKEVIYSYRKSNLDKLSPMTIVNVYEKAWFRNDYELLDRIIHPDSDIKTDKGLPQWQKNEGLAVKVFSVAFGIKDKSTYHKFLDENTAEVGVVSYSIYKVFPKLPIKQLILKNDDGIWKIMGNKNSFDANQMLEQLKENPADASLYYLYSNNIINEHFLTYRFRKRYYELEPDGFWVTNSFIEKLKADEENYEINYEEYERNLLAHINTYGSGRKAREYINLARIFMFHQNNRKAKIYLIEAEYALHQEKSVFYEDVYSRALQEFVMREEGIYVDPLDEIEEFRLKIK